ncbi:hypothetical protein U1Q18_035871 [Sarracenia purpurea var. burkii]
MKKSAFLDWYSLVLAQNWSALPPVQPIPPVISVDSSLNSRIPRFSCQSGTKKGLEKYITVLELSTKPERLL